MSVRESSRTLPIPVQRRDGKTGSHDRISKNGAGGMAPLLSPRSSSTKLRSLVGAVVLFGILQLWWSNSGLEAEEDIIDAQADPLHQLRLKLHEAPKPKVLQASTWTCTYEGDTSAKAKKSRQCVVTNACVDDKGLFLLSHHQQENQRNHEHGKGVNNNNNPPSISTFPEINLMSSRESADYFWRPRFKPMGGGDHARMHYKDETVFVYGLFQPGHFSHFLYDGMLPLFSTMKRFGGKTTSWLMRQGEYLGENLDDQGTWEMEAIVPHGRELVLNAFEVTNSSFQALPPKNVPICFARAVIGLGSQCGLNYCVNNIPTEVYRDYSRRIQEYYWPTRERWRLHMFLRAEQERIRRENSAHHPLDRSLDFSPTKCIHSAQYYNFEIGRPSTEPQLYEPIDRQGSRRLDSRHTDPRKRSQPIVAILRREGSRSVINLDKVISVIAESDYFRLKVISYDHGCGIPETAYLMRDVHILISPHGNALGGSIWMPPTEPSNGSPSYFPAVISIDSTKYSENWFQWTTTSMSQRFMIHRCGPAPSTHSIKSEINPKICPFHRDIVLARKVLAKAKLVLDPHTEHDDLLTLTGEEFPLDLWEKYGAEGVNQFLIEYWKNLARYADPDRLLEILFKIRDDNLPKGDEGDYETEESITEGPDTEVTKRPKKMSYLQLCRESKCCAPLCSGIMHRNVVGPLRAYDQDLSEENWGQLRANKEHDAFVESGLALADWIPI